jgi:CO/xanthine dehydrogenase Mo-binding subunit
VFEGILTADDLPTVDAPGEAGLTNEPLYGGEPVLAIAAVDEQTASEAIEAIQIDYEALPFCLDPLDSLRPGGPNAALASRRRTRACGIGLNSNFRNTMPSARKSSAYFARPVTFARRSVVV